MKLDKIVDDVANDPKKAIVWGIVVLLMVIIIYWLFGKVKLIFTTITDDVRTNIDNPVESDNLTHNKSWYENQANAIFNAMDGIGTDFGAIEAVCIALRTQDDWNQLVRSYGTRTITNWVSGDVTGTLQVCLKADCSNNEVLWIRNYLKGLYNIETGL